MLFISYFQHQKIIQSVLFCLLPILPLIDNKKHLQFASDMVILKVKYFVSTQSTDLTVAPGWTHLRKVG